MWKYTVEVRGMMCAMCESHVNDAVRRALRVKSVRSSRAKNETVVLAEQALDEAALRERMRRVKYELDQAPLYDYVVVNDDLKETAARLHEIVLAENAK